MVEQEVFAALQRDDMNYAAIALYALHRLPLGLRAELRAAGEWEDVVGWALVAAVEGWREGWDFRTTYNAAQRYAYHALRAAWYARESREIGGPTMRYRRRVVVLQEIPERRQR